MWRRTILELGSGRTLHAARRGSGADVLLLHRATTTHHEWLAGPADPLSERRRSSRGLAT
jgi:hypothetical protein